jgi:hypothetical protein
VTVDLPESKSCPDLARFLPRAAGLQSPVVGSSAALDNESDLPVVPVQMEPHHPVWSCSAPRDSEAEGPRARKFGVTFVPRGYRSK